MTFSYSSFHPSYWYFQFYRPKLLQEGQIFLNQPYNRSKFIARLEKQLKYQTFYFHFSLHNHHIPFEFLLNLLSKEVLQINHRLEHSNIWICWFHRFLYPLLRYSSNFQRKRKLNLTFIYPFCFWLSSLEDTWKLTFHFQPFEWRIKSLQTNMGIQHELLGKCFCIELEVKIVLHFLFLDPFQWEFRSMLVHNCWSNTWFHSCKFLS